MMEEDLSEIWKKFSLKDEEEQAVIIEQEWVEETLEMGKSCLLGKLLSRRNTNLEAMKAVFSKLWRTQSGLQIKEVGEKLFLFKFKDEVEKDRVLVNQPWSFNKALMVFRDFDGLVETRAINMEWCPFWVQIHGLPLGMMNKKVGIVLGETLGDVEEFDLSEGDVAWGRFLRVRVNINITKPLKRFSKVHVSEGGQTTILFKYERLPDFVIFVVFLIITKWTVILG
ncbi:hypothetical protein REPUB_Repub12eG0021900 [Reevesia pubescens]